MDGEKIMGMGRWKIIEADVMDGLAQLPSESVHCVVTSPPYYKLRDYGTEGQIGQEDHPRLFIEKLVSVFREVRRVLRNDGTLWLNIGDSYANENKWGGASGCKNKDSAAGGYNRSRVKVPSGLKPKDLMMIPARLALALQKDGWFLRNDGIEEVEVYCPCGCGYILEERIWRWSQDREMIWNKPNARPEPTKDRLTKAHEYVFLFSKKQKYFFDADAISEPAIAGFNGGTFTGNYARRSYSTLAMPRVDIGLRNRRSVLTIATKPSSEQHYASYPPELPSLCIKAGTSEIGCCPRCMAPYRRQTQKKRSFESGSGRSGRPIKGKQDKVEGGGETKDIRRGPVVSTRTIGWQPLCRCNAGDPVPAIVLDPFTGTSSTGRAALSLGRDFVGIDNNPKYCQISRRLLEQACREYTPSLFVRQEDEKRQAELFDVV